MALRKTDHAAGTKIMPTPTTADDTMSVRMEYSLGGAVIANGDVIYFGDLPENCVVVDWAIDNDDLDAGATLSGDLGILNAAKTAVDTAAANGGAWLSNSTSLQAAAFTRMSAQTVAIQTAIARMTASQTPRPVGFVAEAAGNTTTGLIGLTLTYRAKSD
jgi:hypothetical protein